MILIRFRGAVFSVSEVTFLKIVAQTAHKTFVH